MNSLTWEFNLGLILLMTNSLIGWSGILVGIYLAKKTQKEYFITIGILIYILSWAMLALGIVLAGPEGLRISKHIFYKYGWSGVLIILIMIWACINIWKMKNPRRSPGGNNEKNTGS